MSEVTGAAWRSVVDDSWVARGERCSIGLVEGTVSCADKPISPVVEDE
jgi:hypothetical protein